MTDSGDVPVVALIGAGASKASGDYGDSAPPLTRELFETSRARELLAANKKARAAAAALRMLMTDRAESDETLAFEAALRTLQEDGHAHHAAYASAVPPFLRRLMLGYSVDLASRQTRYDALVDRLLQLPATVSFVSLNYDVLLDDHLDGLRPLNIFEDYLPLPRGMTTVRMGPGGGASQEIPANRGGSWALIKPHGSVAWHYDPPSGASASIGGGWELSCRALEKLAAEGEQPHLRPALALPVGDKDELVCPSSHLEYLRTQLDAPTVDVLVLGYSGIDTEMLEIIRAGRCKIRRLTVVNQGEVAALEVMRRLDSFGIRAVWPDVVGQPYAAWIDDGGLRRWVSDYGQRFEHITSPEQARGALVGRLLVDGSVRDLPGWLQEPVDDLGLLRELPGSK